MKRLIYRFLAVVTLTVICATVEAQNEAEFVTWDGIGPDKWGSAWLIHRHINPGATIRFIDTGTVPTSGIAFDIPDIPPYFRTSKHITFENLLAGYQLRNTGLQEINKIIRDIEINYWGEKQSQASPLVEKAFRGLQLKYGRESVPRSCYYDLFDALYQYIDKHSGSGAGAQLEQALAIDEKCGSVTRTTVESDKKYVSEWHLKQILGFLDAGDKVVFIDTRESDEFEEGHIPGAVNIKLRDIGKELPPEVVDADVVIPYCVKDFRGFEVAKRLKKMGVRKVGLMNPWGISGWKSSGLPVAGTRGLQDKDAMQKLKSCVTQPGQCVKNV